MTTATPTRAGAVSSTEAANYLGLSPKTLANWRAQGDGPPYVRHGSRGGRVSYRLIDLDAYLEANLVGAS
ncbi:MAG: helix-turn-helix transcriptional regulator [Brachybacterium tyrofermentans]|uniref:helix-turn-helix transcriptional regulator n=1 Tax=Brachybacterium tyrofermentans TaxID=47848 RepID=UPI003F92DB5A